MKNPNQASSKPNRTRPEYRSHTGPPAQTEKPVCTASPLCEGCPFPGHGFLCQGEDGECIEPWRSYAASTSGNSVDRDVTLDGSGSTQGSNVWYALPAERREAIGLILLYSNQMWDHSISSACSCIPFSRSASEAIPIIWNVFPSSPMSGQSGLMRLGTFSRS